MSSNEAKSETLFNRGLAELERFLMYFEDPALPRATNYFRSAIRLSPDNANYWVGLGFVLDMKEDSNAAMAAMRRAAELDPADEEATVFLLTLLAEAGMESEALTGTRELATRTGVDLESLHQDLVAAEMPVDALALLRSGFLRPRNFVRSRLEDAIEKAERANAGQNSHIHNDHEDCYGRRTELEHEFEIDRVPPALRQLVPWVLRFGIADDPCRELLIEELSREEKDNALQALDEHDAEIQAWLDSYGENPLSTEVAAFMYALLAAEEMKM